MRKLLSKVFFTILAMSCWFLMNGTSSLAQVHYINPDTGYQVTIEDDAKLLTDTERDALAQVMQETTAHGHAIFKTIAENHTDAKTYASTYYMEKHGTESGTLFLIDMKNRMLWIHSDGAVYQTITKAYADTITDNVYTLASAEKYYDCAKDVFTQINSLLAGKRIRQPMKYISNLLLALILALLVNYFFVSMMARLRKPREKEILEMIDHSFQLSKPVKAFSHTTKTYSPVSSSSGGSSGSSGGSRSSGGGGGGSSSGGGGGGSSSGGGGGHRF